MVALPVRLTKIGEKRYTIDVRGYTCPYPTLFTIDAIGRLKAGDTLDVVTNNRPSCQTIPMTAEKHGWKILEVSEIERNLWKISIFK